MNVLALSLAGIYGTPTINSATVSRDYIILNNWVFKNFILADEPIAKTLRIFETYNVLVNNNLCGKLASSLELLIKFDRRFKVTSVPFLIPDFNFLDANHFPFRFDHFPICFIVPSSMKQTNNTKNTLIFKRAFDTESIEELFKQKLYETSWNDIEVSQIPD